ncbi:MAG: hypothetical protein H7248_11080 [Microbacteriaceae bacterium]|nr:hypothetical protein [Microbacteriaceae bacterium]
MFHAMSLRCCHGGIPLLTIAETRALARRCRWNRNDLFLDETIVVNRATALSPEPDVEAYLGGWG